MPSTSEIRTTRAGVTELTRRWKADNPWAAVLIVHGLAEHSGRYERTGQLLANAGLDTRSFDLQGFGTSGGARAYIKRWPTYHDQVLDNLAPGFNSGLPTILMGHSLGGLVAVTYNLSLHRQPDLVVLSSPALDANVPAWQRSAAPVLSRIMPKVRLPNLVKGEQLSRDPAVGEAYFSDPLVYTKTSAKFGSIVFDQIDIVDASYDVYNARTLIIHGGQDSIVPARFSERLAERSNVDRMLYPDLQHETLNEPEGPEIVTDIINWIRKELDGS